MLLGRAYPEVVVADSTIVEFMAAYTDTGASHAALHILNKIKADTLITNHLDDFDLDDDDEFDFVFVYFRSLGSTAGTQYHLNDLGTNGRWGGYSVLLPSAEDVDFVGTGGSVGKTITARREAGAMLLPYARDLNGTGPLVRVRHRWHAMVVAAHEYGHDVWGVHKKGSVGLVGGQDYRSGIRLPSFEERYVADWIDPSIDIDLTAASADTVTTPPCQCD
jgi:hypothetical protein